MDGPEIEVSDIFVVLKERCADKLDETADALRKLGMMVVASDADNGVVEGTLPSDKLAHVRSWDCVEDVRIEFTYLAEFPAPDQAESEAPDDDIVN